MNIIIETYLDYLNEQSSQSNKRKIRYRWCKSHCWNMFHVMDANSRDLMGIESVKACMSKCMKNPITWKPKGGIQEI